jgi:hypothetical protein
VVVHPRRSACPTQCHGGGGRGYSTPAAVGQRNDISCGALDTGWGRAACSSTDHERGVFKASGYAVCLTGGLLGQLGRLGSPLGSSMLNSLILCTSLHWGVLVHATSMRYSTSSPCLPECHTLADPCPRLNPMLSMARTSKCCWRGVGTFACLACKHNTPGCRDWRRCCPTDDHRFSFLQLLGPEGVRRVFAVELPPELLKACARGRDWGKKSRDWSSFVVGISERYQLPSSFNRLMGEFVAVSEFVLAYSSLGAHAAQVACCFCHSCCCGFLVVARTTANKIMCCFGVSGDPESLQLPDGCMCHSKTQRLLVK